MRLPLPTLSATAALAKSIAPLLEVGDVICLKGTLGTGKTAFAKELISSLVPGAEVTSPTFNLVQLYEAPHFTFWHFDLYRLQQARDVVELGIEDAFDHAVSIIEWPEIIHDWLPEDRLEITLTLGKEETSRTAELEGFGSWKDKLRDI